MKKIFVLFKFMVTLIFMFIISQYGYTEDAQVKVEMPKENGVTFTPIVAMETWGTYSINEKKNDVEYKDRSDINFRRLRFGGKGKVYPNVKYSFSFHYDRLSEDPYASTKGSDGGFGLWNAYISAKLLNSSDLINFHAGYYWAAISRESNTSPWAVSSFDKAYSDWYLRKFLTAEGNAIANGAGFGGNKNFGDVFGIGYRLGVYKPEKHVSPQYSNHLYTGRLMFSFGDPEQSKYSYMLSGNHWCKRNGVTVGFGGAYQGETDNEKTGSEHIFFDKSYSYGGDLLINFGGLRIDGEYFIMKRVSESYVDYEGTVWHGRISYNFVAGKYFIEPSFMYSSYEGEGAADLFKYIGDDEMYDFGINWYLNKDKLKLSAHYIIQKGDAASNEGDYAGIALQLKI